MRWLPVVLPKALFAGLNCSNHDRTSSFHPARAVIGRGDLRQFAFIHLLQRDRFLTILTAQ